MHSIGWIKPAFILSAAAMLCLGSGCTADVADSSDSEAAEADPAAPGSEAVANTDGNAEHEKTGKSEDALCGGCGFGVGMPVYGAAIAAPIWGAGWGYATPFWGGGYSTMAYSASYSTGFASTCGMGFGACGAGWGWGF